MRFRCLKTLLLTLSLVTAVEIGTAQNFEQIFDSISVASADHKILKFTLNDSLLKEVSFSLSHPRHSKVKANNVLSGFGKGMLTLISGVGLEDNKENVDLKLTSKVKSNDSKAGWELQLYCKGQIGKDLSRYKTDDGGHSLSIDHFAYVEWDQGITAEILKRNSKIGEFVLIKYTVSTEASTKGPIEFLDEIKKKNVEENKFETKISPQKTGDDFAIIGELYGIDFKVVTNIRQQKFWVFQNETIKAIMQVSDSGGNAFGKNYIILSDPNVSEIESTYWMKLILMAKFLNRTIEKSSFKW